MAERRQFLEKMEALGSGSRELREEVEGEIASKLRTMRGIVWGRQAK